MSEEIYDLIVIGAGPGGYVAAIRATQLGLRVAVVERRNTLGGVCLNEGCIPSKALLESSEHFVMARDKFKSHGIDINPPVLNLSRMMDRKADVVKKLTDGIAYLFNKNNITSFNGTGKLGGVGADGFHVVAVTAEDSQRLVKGKRVLLATGSIPVEIPSLPFDGDLVVDAKGALSFSEVPKHLVVIGAGYIGLELGSVWRRLGSQVTVIEMLPNMLPSTDRQVADALLRTLKKQGISFKMGTKIVDAAIQNELVELNLVAGEKNEKIICNKVLVAAGRKINIAGLGLESTKILYDDSGRIKVNANYETSIPGLYAIGDLVQGPMLAHKASEEGVVFAERLADFDTRINYEYIPGIVYTWPEASSVGKTEETLLKENIPYSAGVSTFMGNGRARSMDETEGFVKVLAHKDSGKLLGVHIIGPRASELIAEAVAIMSSNGTAHDMAMMFHAHPTLSEVLKEAALAVNNTAIHA